MYGRLGCAIKRPARAGLDTAARPPYEAPVQAPVIRPSGSTSSTSSVASHESLTAALAPDRAALLGHPLYAAVHTVAGLRRFMESHVFAVWDFMSLLKSLQTRLTCTRVPWTPPRTRRAARLVNTLVLAEESDEIDGENEPLSHFELYLRAMHEIGADTGPIERHLSALGEGATVTTALDVAGAPPHAARFVRRTFALIDDPHDEAVAAGFLFGREDLVPEMFRRLLPEVERVAGARSLSLYLARHIDLDEDEHGPLARRLLTELCPTPEAWERAAAASQAALAARHALWDGVRDAVVSAPG